MRLNSQETAAILRRRRRRFIHQARKLVKEQIFRPPRPGREKNWTERCSFSPRRGSATRIHPSTHTRASKRPHHNDVENRRPRTHRPCRKNPSTENVRHLNHLFLLRAKKAFRRTDICVLETTNKQKKRTACKVRQKNPNRMSRRGRR